MNWETVQAAVPTIGIVIAAGASCGSLFLLVARFDREGRERISRSREILYERKLQAYPELLTCLGYASDSVGHV